MKEFQDFIEANFSGKEIEVASKILASQLKGVIKQLDSSVCPSPVVIKKHVPEISIRLKNIEYFVLNSIQKEDPILKDIEAKLKEIEQDIYSQKNTKLGVFF